MYEWCMFYAYQFFFLYLNWFNWWVQSKKWSYNLIETEIWARTDRFLPKFSNNSIMICNIYCVWIHIAHRVRSLSLSIHKACCYWICLRKQVEGKIHRCAKNLVSLIQQNWGAYLNQHEWWNKQRIWLWWKRFEK